MKTIDLLVLDEVIVHIEEEAASILESNTLPFNDYSTLNKDAKEWYDHTVDLAARLTALRVGLDAMDVGVSYE